MKAVWVIDYDFRADKCYNAPGCPECREPIGRMFGDGKYYCFSCGEEVEVTDSEMIEWLNIREETKTEYMDCPKITTIDGNHTSGCGGEKCVETHYRRNPVTLEWEVMGGHCSKCGMRFIV